jgi:signal transduction histidine kinase
MDELLPQDRSILEKGFMEFRPFGLDEDGRSIVDVSGITIRANVDYLEEVVAAGRGPEEAARAVAEICRLLNERIRDPAYHVTPEFLRSPWNSYAYEFAAFLTEFCLMLSGDQDFALHVGQEKRITPQVRTLGRPFTVPQIYRMFPHFGEKFAKGSIHFGVGLVTDRSAVLRMKFADHVYVQFGRYRKRCTSLICQSAKGGLMAVPKLVHGLAPAAVRDLRCIAAGDEYCEWEFTWAPEPRPGLLGPMAAGLTGAAAFAYLRLLHPQIAPLESLVVSLLPAAAVWLAHRSRRLRGDVRSREALIREQLESVEARHEELRRAYLEQGHATVQLRRTVSRLATLHRTGLIFNSTLDRDTLIRSVLETLLRELRYDRAMLSFSDQAEGVIRDAWIMGVPAEVAALIGRLPIRIEDPDGIEHRVHVQGRPVLVGDIREERLRLHPLHRELADATDARSIISVPLLVRDRVIGALTVDRIQRHSLTADDLELMATVAAQVAVALDKTDAYRQIEELNVGLEAKVRARTADLESANRRLQELDRLKSVFVSIVSHELRTPMTSIKGYVDNLLDGLAGPLAEKQAACLERVAHNVGRLTRLINDLLDLSRIEAGQVELRPAPLSLADLVHEVVEGLLPLARDKGLAIEARSSPGLPLLQGDRDKLHQVLTNLLQNAVKFTPPGGMIAVDARLDSGALLTSVTDTGCGIAPEEAERIFEKFYRGSGAPAEARGAGLGLAIARSLVELHGGRIWAEPLPAGGSRFTFALPLAGGPGGPTDGRLSGFA